MSIRDLLGNGPLGFGTAPLGNMFRDIPDHEAAATVDAAWNHGTRFFDTAPMYGAGLAEIRLGKYLAQHDRDDYVLSTKVGRLVLDEIDTDEHDSEMFKFGRPNRVVYDYTEKGALKSIEGSLNRLGADRLDFVFVHDPAQDFHGDAWLAQLETARTGAFRALTRLRDQGVIKGWGLGVNLTEPVEFTLGLTEAQPDSVLLAGRYTLLDHEHALQRLMPIAAAQGIDIVIGGPYNSGILAGGTRYEYQTAPAQISAEVARITDIAHRYDVPLKAAALQFSLAHPATAAVIPGASRPERIAEDYAALDTKIPDDFWHEMRDRRLVAANAPLPTNR
ncbi:putative oxidoreductase, aryl-alcohol dehydrogenase like protein (plasmid) [Mycobacterium sp. JS623]|uniref:aldo/keto reductase n=1 Tax=Mycobacterium sp. JS623 TaxID=212767 RepID=UPI0002A5642C|nr:aldo/keto reductase [Mycobacterium sp. JS623]AGB26907.1 putative oxidoreductase, aryl-alcohol dehydrogenase like protein [Mycobacterium sp. JS623]